jgi:hypothetical protein
MAHLSTTETKNFRPLDKRSEYSWEILSARLMRDLGSEFSTFLAEPVTRAKEGVVDWYNESTAPAVPSESLAPGDREKLFERLHALRMRVYELAKKIEVPGRGEGDKRFADALRRATIVPSSGQFVWSVGGQPTLVLWGMVAIDDKRQIEELLAEAARDPRSIEAAQEPGPEVEPIQRSSPEIEPELEPAPEPEAERNPLAWLLWILFASQVLAIFYLLFTNCDATIGAQGNFLRRLGFTVCSSNAADVERLDNQLSRAGLEKPGQSPDMNSSPTGRPNSQAICKELVARGVSCRADAKLQISLGWQGPDDIDLYVDCPGGTLNRSAKGACAGQDYVDTITPIVNKPSVENADWVDPPRGRYKIRAQLYKKVSQGNVDFTVIVKCGDHPIKEISGRLSQKDEVVTVGEIDYPSCQ